MLNKSHPPRYFIPDIGSLTGEESSVKVFEFPTYLHHKLTASDPIPKADGVQQIPNSRGIPDLLFQFFFRVRYQCHCNGHRSWDSVLSTLQLQSVLF